jgi:F420-dependent oxidoreductase-like protein
MLPIMSATKYTRIGYQIPNFTYPGVTSADLFETVAAQAVTAEQSGFDTVFVMDHFFQLPVLGEPDQEMFEAYTLLGALAARTSEARLGTLVTGVTYRHPSLLAKIVTALDVISRGRAVLGIGAAWFDLEHESLGFRFPPLRERYELLGDALRITRSMFTNERSTVTGTHYAVRDAFNSPRPVTEGGPPILIGGAGERVTYRIAAEFADELNIIATADEIPRKLAAVRGHLDDVGRSRDSLRTSWLGNLVIAETAADAESRLAEFLHQRGVDDPVAALADESFRAAQLGRAVWGDPEAVAKRVTELIALGLDGIVFHMPFDGHELDPVRLAGTTLRAAIGQ